MWISQAAYLADVEDRIRMRAELAAAYQIVTAQKATTEWAMIRVAQLEDERAKLLWNFVGIKVPTLAVAAEPPSSDSPLNDQMNALPNFSDMGEDLAAKAGYGWDADGNATLHGVKY